MRPDIEDFEELAAALEDTPRSRAMSWLVLALAVGGFGALAYYAYHSGAESMQNGDVLVVEADSSPIKETPEEPGGEQFANQDKTIYDAIASGSAQNEAEKLLPEPEKPVAVPQAVVEKTVAVPQVVVEKPAPAPAATTFVNKPPVEEVSPVIEKAAAPSKPAPLVIPAKKEVAKKEVTKQVVAAVQPKPKAEAKGVAPKPETHVEAVTAAEVKPAVAEEADPEAGEPTFINESPVAEAKPAAEKPVVAEKEEPKVVEKPVAKASSGGSYQIQLGAFKSEEEANAQWKKLSGKYGSVLTGAPVVVKADLPNGTFYRLRTGGFASPDAAKAACGKLGGAACFPVK